MMTLASSKLKKLHLQDLWDCARALLRPETPQALPKTRRSRQLLFWGDPMDMENGIVFKIWGRWYTYSIVAVFNWHLISLKAEEDQPFGCDDKVGSPHPSGYVRICISDVSSGESVSWLWKVKILTSVRWHCAIVAHAIQPPTSAQVGLAAERISSGRFAMGCISSLLICIEIFAFWEW